MTDTDKIIVAISALDAKTDAVDAKIDAVDAKIDAVDAKIDELGAEMNRRFDHMHGNLSAAIDLIAVRVAQLSNGDDWKKS